MTKFTEDFLPFNSEKVIENMNLINYQLCTECRLKHANFKAISSINYKIFKFKIETILYY